MADNIKYGYGKYIWIVGVITLLGGGSFFAYLESIGLEVECEDKVCEQGTECNINCSIYNPTYTSKYLYNYDNWPITFTPSIKEFKLYAKYYGKWRFTNFTKETRFPNIPEARKYVFVFPRRTTKYFQLRVILNSTQRIKWDFGVLDPTIVGYDYIYENLSDTCPIYRKDLIEVKENCFTNTSTSSIQCNPAYNYPTKTLIGYETCYYKGNRVGLNVGGETYNTPNLNVNAKEGYLYICKIPVGDRNWEEYPMRQFEIDKKVCKLIWLI